MRFLLRRNIYHLLLFKYNIIYIIYPKLKLKWNKFYNAYLLYKNS